MSRGFVLYAPNVHTGGGLVLLRALISGIPEGVGPLTFFLDARARDKLIQPQGSPIHWVMPTVMSRLGAEFKLQNAVTSREDVILCFHGLPPILRSAAQIVVFQQNRNYLGLSSLTEFSWRTAARLLCERMLSRMFRRRVTRYIVQTPAMRRELLQWYGAGDGFINVPDVTLCPFMDNLPMREGLRPLEVRWQFVYVADGEAHKNHKRLIEAWALLASEGIRPSLALTLGSEDDVLRAEIKSASLSYDLKIVDLGPMARERIFDLYGCSGALIFPSTSESFGLPLVEAAHFGIPILAGELDYVRDVCVPDQTFNPLSAISIAKAVKRHLGFEEKTSRFNSATDFWSRLLEET